METATTYAVLTTATVTQEQVDNLLCAAFEGGITYWCGNTQVKGEWPEGAKWVSDTLTRGATIVLHDTEDEDLHELTLDKFLSGIALAAKHWKQDVVTFLEDHDAAGADAAVQYAVFGELVYG